eukprot:CAMPEP_0115840182 /NCGR_PEP_ID=MMETSP0287-20121206/6639_1 /TAXON_ID=412157 /ORGANISM="Chrysochromulina rotalis, Strain UIO044" /LENGTH=115 /DNA_ID=CAMNT_0003293785 /DNA_START=402 /DNA_END=750 /DNA_ORIENTATION=-
MADLGAPRGRVVAARSHAPTTYCMGVQALIVRVQDNKLVLHGAGKPPPKLVAQLAHRLVPSRSARNNVQGDPPAKMLAQCSHARVGNIVGRQNELKRAQPGHRLPIMRLREGIDT